MVCHLQDLGGVLRRLIHNTPAGTGPGARLHTDLSTPLIGAALAWIDAHLDVLTIEQAWALCDEVIPAGMMDALLAGWDEDTPTPETAVLHRLYTRARPRLRALGDPPSYARKTWTCAERSPRMLLDLSTQAVERLFADGLDPLKGITRGDLATLVLMHDLPSLDQAWTVHAPRTNPAYTHWEDKGYWMPARVGRTGARWMVKAFDDHFRTAKYDHARKWTSQRFVDPRLHLVALLSWDTFPGDGKMGIETKDHGYNRLTPCWTPMFELLESAPDQRSAHQKLLHAAFLQQIPTREDILRMERLPDDPMGFADHLGRCQVPAGRVDQAA